MLANEGTEMTCPVTSAVTSQSQPAADASESGDVVEQFNRFAGSVFVALFAAALYDQAMLPAVSAALEDTGRIRNTPWLRALRTAASDQIVFSGEEADRRAEAERLVRLHRDVKGVGSNGVRYSALNPESWNFILISTFFMHRNAFIATTGEQLDAAANQAAWDHFRQLSADLQLPGRSRLIEDYDQLTAYYDHLVTEKLESTSTLECAVAYTMRPARPDFLPVLTAPLWAITSPLIGHVLTVLGFGIMHPGVRAQLPTVWTRRHDVEFQLLTALIRSAYRWLPRRLTDTPLARNRRDYERLIARYKGIGLTSFAAD